MGTSAVPGSVPGSMPATHRLRVTLSETGRDFSLSPSKQYASAVEPDIRDNHQLKCLSTFHATPTRAVYEHKQRRPDTPSLKLAKLLAPLIASINLQQIESHSLAQRSALSNSHIIPLLDSKAWRNVGSEVLVTFLVSIVFLDIVEVVTTK